MQIKFISLNLWLGGKLIDPLWDFLEHEKPDILALQEAYDSKDQNLEKRFRSIEEIKKKYGLSHCHFSPTCTSILPEGKIPAGNAILTHFPITESDTAFFYSELKEITDYEVPDKGFSHPRNLQHALIKVENTKLNVFNIQGIWRKDNEDNEDRLEMSKLIVKEVGNKDKVILAGDFNITPNTQTINSIEKHLKNIFKNQLETTFNIKRKEDRIYRNLVVDMIFSSDDLKIIDSYCPNVDISDHLPLVVIFEI